MAWQPRRRVRRYHLKRIVEVKLGFVRAGLKPWVRHQCPVDFGDTWQATVHRGPKRALRLISNSGTPEGAVQGLLAQLQAMGYSGNARIVD